VAGFDQPPPYGLVRGWLGAEAVVRLLAYAQSNRERFVESGVGYGSKGRIDSTRRRSQKLKNFGELSDEIAIKIKELLPAMFERLGGQPFAASKFELELVAHNDGAFFAKHLDTFAREPGVTSHRVISGVYYFHSLPKSFSGGVLRLYSIAATPEAGKFVDVEPENDTLVFFPSWFPHEVLPVVCPSGRFEHSRFAVNCWVHRSND
jgi:SM-20-related protein